MGQFQAHSSSDIDTVVITGSGDLSFINEWEGEIDAGDGHFIVNETQNLAREISDRASTSTIETATLGAGDYDSDYFNIFPPPGTGFNINVTASGSAGSITAGEYIFGTTFIYDAEPGDIFSQESMIYENKGQITADGNDSFLWNVTLTGPYNARITGGRLYTKGLTTSGVENPEPEWKMLGEISLKHGYRKDLNDAYSAWSYYDVSAGAIYKGGVNGSATSDILYTHSLSPITWEINTGLSESDLSTAAKFKTAVVANRIAYIGNVQKDGITYGDAIIKSPVNKFDIFPKSRMIETSVRDGDSIVKLETYADRLLIFKKNKLELLNISQEVEFLEDTFMHKGVSHPAATCKTDFGIAWVNTKGCYLYDGQKVNNLLEKKGRQIINESEWDTFADEPMIGYVPKKRQIIVVDDITTTGDGAIYLYDIVTQSWVKGSAATVFDQPKTNFIIDWDGDLMYAHTNDQGTLVKWADSSHSSTSMVISTKDIDFGNPGQKKTVYKVIVTYQSDNNTTHVQVDYGVNGGTTFPYDFTVPELPAANGWQTAELVPDVQSEASNIKSFRLRFATDSTVPAAFEINDITIVYRLKGIR